MRFKTVLAERERDSSPNGKRINICNLLRSLGESSRLNGSLFPLPFSFFFFFSFDLRKEYCNFHENLNINKIIIHKNFDLTKIK